MAATFAFIIMNQIKMEKVEATTNKNNMLKNMIMHHLTSFQNNDLEAIISDYTNESILITQTDTYKGIKAIEKFFAGLIQVFPKQNSSFELDKLVINGDLIYIVWHAKTLFLNISLGSDTFIVKDGKIYQQTYVRQATPDPGL